MPKRLWVATVWFQFVVAAEDRDEANQVASESVSDDLDNAVLRDVVEQVRPLVSLSALPFPWTGDCIPWGSEDDQTCADVFASMIPTDAEVEAAGQLSLAGE